MRMFAGANADDMIDQHVVRQPCTLGDKRSVANSKRIASILPQKHCDKHLFEFADVFIGWAVHYRL